MRGEMRVVVGAHVERLDDDHAVVSLTIGDTPEGPEAVLVLSSIVDEFTHDDPDCPACAGTGTVCEVHARPWDPGPGDTPPGACSCGAPGMPCPYAKGARP